MKKLIIVTVVLLIILGAFIIKTLYQAGQFKIIEPHFSGTVEVIPGIIGGEDITIHHKTGLAFISADDRFKGLHGLEGWEGGIYGMNLHADNAKPVLLTRHLDYVINPHGISFYMEDSTYYLYAIDHSNKKHSIILFRYDGFGKMDTVRTFRDKTLISPNDVQAIDKERFYFTNDHGSGSELGKKAEEYLQLKKSHVVYFDGNEYKVVAENIGYANGINMSVDGREVYVAATIDRSILIYDRNENDGSLTLKETIFVNTGVDNIELDEAGNLWVGCHPKLLSFVAHSKDINQPAPSQVIKVWKDDHGAYQHEEIYLNDGEAISASSVAAVTGNIMLIGPVFDDRVLRCYLP